MVNYLIPFISLWHQTTYYNGLHPLSTAGEDKVDQHSVVAVSKHANALALMQLAELTHPVVASPDHPLSNKLERGLRKIIPSAK